MRLGKILLSKENIGVCDVYWVGSFVCRPLPWQMGTLFKYERSTTEIQWRNTIEIQTGCGIYCELLSIAFELAFVSWSAFGFSFSLFQFKLKDQYKSKHMVHNWEEYDTKKISNTKQMQLILCKHIAFCNNSFSIIWPE